MRLKTKSFGVDCEGIQLEGNPKNPEPTHTRITFPGGDVDVVRTSNGEYWVHVRVNRDDSTSYDPCAPTGELVDGRIDLSQGYPTDAQKSALNDSKLQHLAIRIGNIKPAKA